MFPFACPVGLWPLAFWLLVFGFWLFGCLAVWHFGFLAVWHFGFLAVWLFGFWLWLLAFGFWLLASVSFFASDSWLMALRLLALASLGCWLWFHLAFGFWPKETLNEPLKKP